MQYFRLSNYKNIKEFKTRTTIPEEKSKLVESIRETMAFFMCDKCPFYTIHEPSYYVDLHHNHAGHPRDAPNLVSNLFPNLPPTTSMFLPGQTCSTLVYGAYERLDQLK